MEKTGVPTRSQQATNQQDNEPAKMVVDSPAARLRPSFPTMDNEIDFQRSDELTNQMTKRTSTTNNKSTQSHNDADDKEAAHKQPDRTKSARSVYQSNANNEGEFQSNCEFTSSF